MRLEPAARAAAGRLRGIAVPPVTITPPPGGVVLERDVPVVVRDGTTLRANVFRPATGGPWPVIMCAHPYGKDRFPRHRAGRYWPELQYRMLHQPAPVRFSAWTTWEAPDPGSWVPLGYVVVNVDLRGFGTSGGVGTLLSAQEGEDYFDVIEWAAAQPWSTGRIGLNGVSYLALSQWRVAALRPPHLAAICPWEGFTDVYRDFARPGGVREDGFLPLWARGVRRGGRLAEDVRAEQVERPLLDDWWRAAMPDLGRIETPALVCGSFSDHALHSRGSFEGFRRIASDRKWLYTHRAGKWATYYSEDALAAQRRFFDHFLKDADNGMDDVAAVRLAVYDRGDRPDRVTAEDAFPPRDVEWTPLHLGADGTLARAGAAGPSGTMAFELRDGCASFAWVADADVEVVGPMALRVPVEAVGTDELPLYAGVRKFRAGTEIVFEGSYGFGRDLVTKGMLKVSHRELDRERSEPWWPVHRHDRSRPLGRGELVVADVALLPSATRFRRGDVLRLDVQGHWFHARNPLTGAFPAWYEPSPPGRAVLHLGGAHEARLLVPMRPR